MFPGIMSIVWLAFTAALMVSDHYTEALICAVIVNMWGATLWLEARIDKGKETQND